MTITLDRDMSALSSAEIQKDSFVVVPLLYLDFDGLLQNYAGSNVNIQVKTSTVIPAATYVGVGGISTISVVEERSDLGATTLTAELNSLDSQTVALVLANQYFGRDASFAVGILDSSYTLIGEPLLLYKGFMSVLTAEIAEQAKFTVEIDSIFRNWERPRVLRYNTPTQTSIDPLDRGFNNVAPIVNKEITWG